MTDSDSATTEYVRPADRATVQTQVRRVRGREGVLAIRAVPRWDADATLDVDGERVTVITGATTLAVRDGLSRRHAIEGRLVILTDLPDEQLGDGIRDHLVGRRVRNPDAWQALRDLFGATAQESSLLSGSDVARAALRRLADGPPPRAALGGVLTRDLLFDTLLGHALGLDATTVVDLLVWSALPDADHRYRAWAGEGDPGLREDTLRWLDSRWGAPCAGILGALRAGRSPSDLLPIGLLAEVVTPLGGAGESDDGESRDADLERRVLVTRTRLESLVGMALPAPSLEGWAASAVLAADRLADDPMLAAVQRRADVIAAEIGAGELVERSDYLPGALDLRLARFADAARPVTAGRGDVDGVAMDRLESTWNRIAEHAMVSARPDESWPRDVGLAIAVLRLLRFTAVEDPQWRTLSAAVAWYRATGSWVDAAVNDAFVGSDRPALAEVAHRAVQLTRERRSVQDRSAAALLAAGAAFRPTDRQRDPVMIEDVLDRIVLPLTVPRPPETGFGGSRDDGSGDRRGVLIVVADGMSCAAANDVLIDLTRRQAAVWQPVDVIEDGRPLDAAVAVLPTVTDRSRCSLLCGRVAGGAQADEVGGFASWLSAHSRGSRSRTLFHKADIEAVSAGHALPTEVREAIDDITGRPIVACVLNAIDDALDRSDPIGTRWTASTLHPLDALLHAATRVGRIVVLVSDHGHVVERRERELQRGDTRSARWRPAPEGVPVSDDEVLVEGDRVLTDNVRAVLAVDEQLRYTPRKAGYHGGAALAEFVVPIAVLVQGEIPPHLPLAASGAVPTWWVGAGSLTRSVADPQSADRPWATPPRTPPRTPAHDTGPALFDEPTASAPGWEDRVDRLVRTRLFTNNRARFAPQVPVERIGRLLRALTAAGGTLGRPQAGAALGVTDRRLAGNLAVIGQVLNIDGVVVLGQTATEVTLNETLLYEQFGMNR